MDIQKIYQERFLLEKEYGGNDKPVNKVLPLVSVCVITYQHVNFISDCLEGILMQQTFFPIEIIIGEDESTDGTREICIEYASKYPDKIRLYLRNRKTSQLFDENGKYICRFNGRWNRESARGKYIALCEGDDYWTDPLKLQKQVNIMENNTRIYGCFHSVEIKDEFFNKLNNYYPTRSNQLISTVQMIWDHYVPTCSLLFRTKILNNIDFQNAPNGILGFDRFLELQISMFGSFYFIDQIMGVHVKHK